MPGSHKRVQSSDLKASGGELKELRLAGTSILFWIPFSTQCPGHVTQSS